MENLKKEHIYQVDCKYQDGVRVSYTNKKIEKYDIPEGCKEIVYYKGQSCKSYPAEIVEKSEISPTERTMLEELKKPAGGNSAYEIEYDWGKDRPTMQYSDVTENEMFGFPEISQNVLVSPENGLWAYHGLRKLKFTFDNLQPEGDNWEISANLVFEYRDNDKMSQAISSEEKDILQNITYEADESHRGYEFFVYVNTNKLGDKFDNEFANKQAILFAGNIQITFKDATNNKANVVTYVFPVELQVNNTKFSQCKKLQKSVVSIDFGTSSSCVAVRGENGVELITLSAEEEDKKDINIYENPTCVMIYRWKEIYEQWRKDNDDLPIILKGNLDEHKLDKKSVEFDFGYSVKNCLKEVNDQELNSIMTEIKMIPKFLDEGEQISVRPLVTQEKRVVDLVDAYENQDDEKLDIIAFYGYILGKAINRIENNKIYTKFQITYPVKFSSAVRDKVKASLEHGLRRALPKPLREAMNAKGKPVFKVDMKYPEPVAYIGSVCGKYLTYDVEKPEAQMFAVFDFGGGTLDYSFGVFAPDETDPNSSNIYVLGVDGDSDVGGELLIKKMSYWLYTSQENMSTLVKKQIPFEKPVGEVLPDGCPENMFNSTANAKSNVRKISERITRMIFQSTDVEVSENNDESQESESSTMGSRLKIQKQNGAAESSKGKKMHSSSPSSVILVVLCDINGKEVSIEVSVDESELKRKLKEILQKKVEDFTNSMDRTFENHKDLLEQCKIKKYERKNVHIFEAGNSSRNQILQEEMKKVFDDDKIMLIDETSDNFMIKNNQGAKPKKIALTPKTAVAFGQVILSDYYVDDSFIHQGTGDAPFNWYIGTINRGNNVFSMLIDKANVNNEWKFYGRINSEQMQIYYAETPVDNADDSKLRSVDVDSLDEDDMQKMLWIRVEGSDSLQCCVCEKNQKPSDVEESEYFSVSLR